MSIKSPDPGSPDTVAGLLVIVGMIAVIVLFIAKLAH